MKKNWLVLIAATAAVAALIVVMAATRANTELRNLTSVLVSRINQLETQLSQQEAYLARLTSPDVRVINLAGRGLAAPAAAKIFLKTGV